MSRALPSWMYRNPEEVLERKQESEARRSCVGCVHSFAIEFKAVGQWGVTKIGSMAFGVTYTGVNKYV